jgi:hypothetical protein
MHASRHSLWPQVSFRHISCLKERFRQRVWRDQRSARHYGGKKHVSAFPLTRRQAIFYNIVGHVVIFVKKFEIGKLWRKEAILESEYAAPISMHYAPVDTFAVCQAD